MTRDINAATATASSASTIRPVMFVALEFDSATVRFHSELGDLTFDGDTYTGTGRLGDISPMDEESELARTPITLSLSGLPTDLLGAFLDEHYQGRRATVYLGYFDDNRALVDDPIVLYRGRMNQPQIERGETLRIALTVESRFAAWDRPQVRRYNNADQQSRYPGDKGLEFVEKSANVQVFWGA